jgi:uncharacterized damage-inducible protein DinB
MSAEVERFGLLLRHDLWANRTTLESLREARPLPPKALAWMAHIVGSEVLWLARLREETSTMAVWPELDLDACQAALATIEGEWTRSVAGLTEAALADGVGYRNSKGEYWTSTVADILSHVVLHSSYHRGQIASELRAAGATPAYTDFIHAVRQGLVE